MITRILSRFSPRVAAALVLACVAVPAASRADVIIYNNLSSIVNFQANGGATTGTGNTAFLADDLTLLGGYANFKDTAFAVDIGSQNTGTFNANITAEFFATDGVGGAPGTLLGIMTLNNVAIAAGYAAGNRVVFTGSNLFTVPTNGKIWAGIYFTGLSGTDPTALNKLGVEIESGGSGPGSSVASTYFSSTTPAVAGSPSGSIAANGNGNLGLIASVPEPSSVLFTAIIGAGLAGIVARRRKR